VRGHTWSAGTRFRMWLLAFFVAASVHFFSFDLWRQPIFTDISFFLYFASRIAQGGVPYVDFFENKTPLAFLVGAWLHCAGDGLGIDPLYVIRAGFLLLAAAATTALAATLVRIHHDRLAAGWIGLAAVAGFNLLGQLAATGNVPKIIGLAAACVAMLCVRGRSWGWAGICAAIAGMDWQPLGALTAAGVLLAGAASDARWRSTGRAIAGVIAGVAPLLVYLAWHGALAAFFRMAVWGSLNKAAADPISVPDRLATIWGLILVYDGRVMWLVAAAALGAALFGGMLVGRRRSDQWPFLLSAAVYHYGVLAFSLVDFQGRGDLMILEGSLAFFGAVGVFRLYDTLLQWVLAISGPRGRWLHGAYGLAAVVLLITLIQPSFLQRGWRVNAPPIGPGDVVLASQRQVADRFCEIVPDGPVAFLKKQEILFLKRRPNALPFVYWNLANSTYWRAPGEGRLDTLARLLRDARLDAIVLPRRWLPKLLRADLGSWLTRHYVPARISSDDAAYSLVAWIRSDLPRRNVRGVRYVVPERFTDTPDVPPS